MKTGLGLYSKYLTIIAYVNLFRFSVRKYLLGFEYANIFIQRVDKVSVQLILKKNGAKIGTDCDIETGLTFHNCKNYSNLKIGDNCHIGKNCFFDLRDKITIEKNAVISMQTTFITHIDMLKSNLTYRYPPIQSKIIIYHDTYIGAKSTVLMGVTIGAGSFIAAGSMVTKNIPPDTMIGGISGRFIRKLK